jgi:Cu/Zn superoxide dismutase
VLTRWGYALFIETDGSVEIIADIEGLDPNSTHGFHIHEFGDCSALDCKSAGSHYNPEIPRKIENFSIKDAVKKRGKRTFYPFSNGV